MNYLLYYRGQAGGKYYALRRRRPKERRSSSSLFLLFFISGIALLVAQFMCAAFLPNDNNTADVMNRMSLLRPSSYRRRVPTRRHRHQMQPIISYGRRPLRSSEVGLPEYPINHRQAAADTPAIAISNKAISACNHALWRTLESTTYVLPNNETFVFTGDIYDLWVRDSAAQTHTLLLPSAFNGMSLAQSDPRIERIVSGLILKTARFIRYDPYANAFRMKDDYNFNEFERDVLGRHGFIATWNYELDSACYFMRMLYFFHQNFPNHPVFQLREVKEAVIIMIDVWIAEQRHEDDFYPEGELFDCYHCDSLPYRYNPDELPRDGKGSATNSSAGLTWSGFRPSDDPCMFGYLIPSNMFVVVVLGYMMELCDSVWQDELLKEKSNKLQEEIHFGITEHGIVDHPKYGRIYAFEVDGLGNSLLMDDANVPNLLSIPYIGYQYDEEVYANTKRFILSDDNPTFHKGEFDRMKIEGIGSPHNLKRIPNEIWPMGLIMQGLVSDDRNEKVEIVDKLLLASAGSNQMHEGFNANNPSEYSRSWFCWADSLFAELVMSLSDECPQYLNSYEYLMHGLFSRSIQ